jgi:hypothetical protein
MLVFFNAFDLIPQPLLAQEKGRSDVSDADEWLRELRGGTN